MRHVPMAAVTAGLLLPAIALALSPDVELKRELDALYPIVQVDREDTAIDASEAALEAMPEFFPDDGTDLGDRQDVEGSDTYVTFRLQGVPYVLTDVPLKDWFAPYVRDMTERGIVTGYTTAAGIPTGVFAPAKGVSLEELAKMAVEAAGIDRSTCPELPKNPIAAQSWSARYVACAEAHLFAVFEDATVDVRRAATRSEVVMTVIQAFGIPVQEPGAGEQIFPDVAASVLFSGAIKTAVADGIISGYPDGTFGPALGINRAEVSKILSLAIQVYGRG